MEMVPENTSSKLKKGDLVKWWYTSPRLPHTIDDDNIKNWTDVGIVLSVELWEGGHQGIREVIEVYFIKAGPSWCNPKSLELISKY
jgi:hypothetical protein